MTIMLVLPRPPSVNACFRNVLGKGRAKTGHYNAWLSEAGWELKRQRPRAVQGAYALDIFVGPGRTDIDNYAKATSDLLVKHGVVEDDGPKFAKRVDVEAVETIPAGQIHCIVRPWGDVGRIADQFTFPDQAKGL